MIKTSNIRKGFSSAFIIPYYEEGYEQKQGRKNFFIFETIKGLFSQTDDDWCAIIVVDMSPNKTTHNLFTSIKAKILSKDRRNFSNKECGCRNM